MNEIKWDRYMHLSGQEQARTWLTIQVHLGLAANTLAAYARALDEYLLFCESREIDVLQAKREHIALYVNDLANRAHPNHTLKGLSSATLQQRLTAVRLYYDYLVEEAIRERNPVGRGRYVHGRAFAPLSQRGLIPQYRRLPWIPNAEEWRAILEAARHEPLRNRFMLALSYDSALRREELCSLQTSDLDPAHRLVHIRAETTKTHQARVVPYSPVTGELFALYLDERRSLSRERGRLLLSTSPRNRGQPITIWTWSKVVHQIALRAGVSQFSTHTPRHLCLTNLARAHWDLHEIAQFAGHRTTQTTLLYIHLSGRELSDKLAQSMESIQMWNRQMLENLLT